MKTQISIFLLSTLLLTSCGAPPSASTTEENCVGNCSERDLNPPVAEAPAEPSSPEIENADYNFPAFRTTWGLRRELFEKAKNYYENTRVNAGNRRFVSIVDFSLHSSKKRYYLIDLKEGTVQRYLTSAGVNSDPDNDGYATLFSNTPESRQSSLGFYVTLNTYTGSKGYSLRLNGLDNTNSNAYDRAIVIHPADYVQEENNYAGRSWGCPALDPSISRSVIDKIKNGSLLLIDR